MDKKTTETKNQESNTKVKVLSLFLQYDDLIGKGPFSSFGNTFSKLLMVSFRQL